MTPIHDSELTRVLCGREIDEGGLEACEVAGLSLPSLIWCVELLGMKVEEEAELLRGGSAIGELRDLNADLEVVDPLEGWLDNGVARVLLHDGDIGSSAPRVGIDDAADAVVAGIAGVSSAVNASETVTIVHVERGVFDEALTPWHWA